MDILVVLKQMCILLAMMLTGYITCKLGFVDRDVYSKLSKIVVSIFNPILIIDSVIGKSLHTTGVVFWENLILVFLFYTLLFLAGFLLILVLRPSDVDSPIYRMMMLLPNIGFMGIPIVAALLGTDYIIYVAVYMLFYNIILYTYGIFLCKKSARADGKVASETKQPWFKPIITNPGVIASVIALLIFFLNLPVPEAVSTFCGYMGNPSIPLSMYLIGCSVAFSDIRAMLKDKKTYGFLLFKMLLFPIACTFLVHLLPYDNNIIKLFIIMTAMPAGSLVVLVSEEYAGNTTAATNGVVLSTILSILSLPLVSIFM